MHAPFLASAGAPSPTASKSSSGGFSLDRNRCSGRMPAVENMARGAEKFFAASFSGAY